jgi:hypothetical protein
MIRIPRAALWITMWPGYELSWSAMLRRRRISEPYTEWDISSCRDGLLLESFADFNIVLQDIGQKFRETDALLLRPAREVLPDTPLDRGGQENPCARRDMMQASNAFAEIDLSEHVVVNRLVIHTACS